MNKYIYYIISIMIINSCSITKNKQTRTFHKTKNGVIPYNANTLIIREREKENDTLWAIFRPPIRYGSFTKEKYTGIYIVRNPHNHRLFFKCNIENGILVGDTYSYYPNEQLMRQAYYLKGRFQGYSISYYSNGIIEEIGCYCNFKKVGTWSYYDTNGELLKIEDYGQIPDTCQIPNQYLYDSLPEKYKNVREAFISPLDK